MNNKKQLSRMLGLLLVVLMSGQTIHAQSLKKLSKTFVASVHNQDIDAMMSHYADTVHYQDAIWGADDHFSTATVRSFYEPMFDSNSTADPKISTVALDEKNNAMILKGSSYDTTEKGRMPFVVYFRFEKGKIVEQMDFPVYSVQSLKDSPRYKPFMK